MALVSQAGCDWKRRFWSQKSCLRRSRRLKKKTMIGNEDLDWKEGSIEHMTLMKKGHGWQRLWWTTSFGLNEWLWISKADCEWKTRFWSRRLTQGRWRRSLWLKFKGEDNDWKCLGLKRGFWLKRWPCLAWKTWLGLNKWCLFPKLTVREEEDFDPQKIVWEVDRDERTKVISKGSNCNAGFDYEDAVQYRSVLNGRFQTPRLSE